MSRVKRGVTARARHKKVLDAAKGYRGRRKNGTYIWVEASLTRSLDPETGKDLSGYGPAAIRDYAKLTFPHAEEPGKERTDHGRRYRLLMKMADAKEAPAGGDQ